MSCRSKPSRNLKEDVLDLVFERLEEALCSQQQQDEKKKQTPIEGENTKFSLDGILKQIDEMVLSLNSIDKKAAKANVEKVLEKYVEDLACVLSDNAQKSGEKDIPFDDAFEWMEGILCNHMDHSLLGEETDRDALDEVFERLEAVACSEASSVAITDGENRDDTEQSSQTLLHSARTTAFRGCVKNQHKQLLVTTTRDCLSGGRERRTWTHRDTGTGTTKPAHLEVRNLLSLSTSNSADDMRSEIDIPSLYKISEEPSEYYSTEETSVHSRPVSSHSRQSKGPAGEPTTPTNSNESTTTNSKSFLAVVGERLETTLRDIDIQKYITCNGPPSQDTSDATDDVGTPKDTLAEEETTKPPNLASESNLLPNDLDLAIDPLDDLPPLTGRPSPTSMRAQKLSSPRAERGSPTIDGRARTNSPSLGTINGRVRTPPNAMPLALDGRVRTRKAAMLAKMDGLQRMKLAQGNCAREDEKHTEDSPSKDDISAISSRAQVDKSKDCESAIISVRSFDSSLPSSGTSDDSYFRWDKRPVRSWGYGTRTSKGSSSEMTVKHTNCTTKDTKPLAPLPPLCASAKKNKSALLLRKDSSTSTALDMLTKVAMVDESSEEASEVSSTSLVKASGVVAIGPKPFDEEDEDSSRESRSIDDISSEDESNSSESSKYESAASTNSTPSTPSDEGNGSRSDAHHREELDSDSDIESASSSHAIDKKPTAETENSDENPADDRTATPNADDMLQKEHREDENNSERSTRSNGSEASLRLELEQKKLALDSTRKGLESAESRVKLLAGQLKDLISRKRELDATRARHEASEQRVSSLGGQAGMLQGQIMRLQDDMEKLASEMIESSKATVGSTATNLTPADLEWTTTNSADASDKSGSTRYSEAISGSLSAYIEPTACLSGLDSFADASQGLDLIDQDLEEVPSLDVAKTRSIVYEHVPEATLSQDDTTWPSLQDTIDVSKPSKNDTEECDDETPQGDQNAALKLMLVIMWMSMSFLLDVNGKVNKDFEKKRRQIQKELMGKESVSGADVMSVVRQQVAPASRE